jgi:O-antigen/teichoic acid export membrane protein
MALVFTGLGGVFSNLALSSALVQRETLREEDRSTAFWTNIAAGVVFTAIGIAVSPLVADFFSRPAVAPLFAASSTLFLLWSLSATQVALLTRDLNFRSLEIRTIPSTLAGAAAAVLLALAGAGAWAIVGQVLVSAGTSFVLLWTATVWRPRFVYSRESLRTLGSFSSKTLLSQTLEYGASNADNLLVGRFLGSFALGIYSVAYNTMILPIGRVSQPIQQVLFAALARLQREPGRLVDAWTRGNQVVAAVNVPAFLGMAVVAPDFVPVVLGHKWEPAVAVLQLLSLAGIATSLQALNWSAMQAMGRPEVMLRLRLISVPLTIAAFGIGLHWGVVGVAGFYAAARFVVLPLNIALTCRALRCSVLRAIRGEILITAFALIMAGAVWVLRVGLVRAQVAPAERLVVLVLVGFAVYTALVTWRVRPVMTAVGVLLRGRPA